MVQAEFFSEDYNIFKNSLWAKDFSLLVSHLIKRKGIKSGGENIAKDISYPLFERFIIQFFIILKLRQVN